MPRNLEIKAKVSDIQSVELSAKNLKASFAEILNQVDTYFVTSHGRLKLREINEKEAELIYYTRAEETTQRMSNFIVYPVIDATALKNILALSLGIKVAVKKCRKLYMYETTRIHLDEVEGLGSFIEFEVPVGESEKKAQETLEVLIRQFGIKNEDFFKESYSDLLLNCSSG